MKDFLKSRIHGAVVFLVGLVLTVVLFQMALDAHSHRGAGVLVGPLIASAGLGLMIFGDRVRYGEDRLVWLCLLPGLIGGWWLAIIAQSGDHRLLERGREIFTGMVGVPSGTEAEFKEKLVGTWKFQYDQSRTMGPKVTFTGRVIYQRDGKTSFECTQTDRTSDYSTYGWSGRWELRGNHLHTTVESLTPSYDLKVGDTHDYLIREITSDELHYRDLNDAAERVRYRVNP